MVFSSYINLTNKEAIDPNGKKLPSLTNLGMGYVFEELIRKFNEDNNPGCWRGFPLIAPSDIPGLSEENKKLIISSTGSNRLSTDSAGKICGGI